MGKRLKLIDTIEQIQGDALEDRIKDVFRLGYVVRVQPYYFDPGVGPFGSPLEPYLRYRIRVYKEVID